MGVRGKERDIGREGRKENGRQRERKGGKGESPFWYQSLESPLTCHLETQGDQWYHSVHVQSPENQ